MNWSRTGHWIYNTSMVRTVDINEKNDFNKLAIHPLQAWEWGDFRLKTGIDVKRLGRYENTKLVETALITIHPIPMTSYKIGYFPKGKIPSREMTDYLRTLGQKEKIIFFKLEPNVVKNNESRIMNHELDIRPSPHPLFTKYTFQLDLRKSEEELLKNMHPKTRYNIRLAEKKGVTIVEDSSRHAFSEYLRLTRETTVRQKFFAHTEKYHRLMWETLQPAGIAKLFLAKFPGNGKENILVAWILFVFNGVLYYPYGASSHLHRNLMPSNLMMWNTIKFGKKNKCEMFDMWGALSPEPSINDPWYGFHKFKEGYGPKLTELIGSYDLIINPLLYYIYNASNTLRNLYLSFRAALRK